MVSRISSRFHPSSMEIISFDISVSLSSSIILLPELATANSKFLSFFFDCCCCFTCCASYFANSGTIVSKKYTFVVGCGPRKEWNKHCDVKRTFSALGFAKGSLPKDVLGQMCVYHYNNLLSMYFEEWDRGGKGYFVNWWETDVNFVDVPWNLKKLWQLQLYSN